MICQSGLTRLLKNRKRGKRLFTPSDGCIQMKSQFMLLLDYFNLVITGSFNMDNLWPRGTSPECPTVEVLFCQRSMLRNDIHIDDSIAHVFYGTRCNLKGAQYASNKVLFRSNGIWTFRNRQSDKPAHFTQWSNGLAEVWKKGGFELFSFFTQLLPSLFVCANTWDAINESVCHYFIFEQF